MYEFLTIQEISYRMRLDILQDKEITNIFILMDFYSWHSITKTIYSTTLEMDMGAGVVISGGDSSKRHLVSPLSIKLHTFLLVLTNFNINKLRGCVIFNLDKKYVIPQFNLQEVNKPGLHKKRIESVDKNKRNKNSRNLYKDLVTDELYENIKDESVNDQNKDIGECVQTNDLIIYTKPNISLTIYTKANIYLTIYTKANNKDDSNNNNTNN